MQFKKTTTISISQDSKSIFESLEELRPDTISFSTFLSIAVEEYVLNHKQQTTSKYPRIMARLGAWNDCIGDMSDGDLIRINKRVAQLTNRLARELHKRV